MYKTCANRNHLKIATLGSSSVQRYWISSSLKMSDGPANSFEMKSSSAKACWDIYYNRKAAYEEIANDVKALNKFKTSWVRIPTLSDVTKATSYDWTQPITSAFVRSRVKPMEKAFTNIGLSVDKTVAKEEVGPKEAEGSVASKIADVMFYNDADVQKADSKTFDDIDEQILMEDRRIDGVFTKHLGRTSQLKKFTDFDFLDREAQTYNRFYDHIDGLEHTNAMEVYVEPKTKTQTEQNEKTDGLVKQAEKLAIVSNSYDHPDGPDKIADIEEVEIIEVLGPLIDVRESNQPNVKNKHESVANMDEASDVAKVEEPLNSSINKPSPSSAAAKVDAPEVVAKQSPEEQVAQVAQSRVVPEGGIYLTSETANEAPADIREMFRVEISYDSIEPRTVVIDNLQPI